MAGAAIVAAFVVGFLSRRPKVTSPIKELDDKVRGIERATEAKEQQLAIERDSKIATIEKDRQEELNAVVEAQQDVYVDLQDNPEKVNVWLHDIGKKQRQ